MVILAETILPDFEDQAEEATLYPSDGTVLLRIVAALVLVIWMLEDLLYTCPQLSHGDPPGKLGASIQEIFEHPYYQDQRCDDPEQYRAIGWVQGRLFSLIFEIREDRLGEYYHLVTLWRATLQERKLYEENA